MFLLFTVRIGIWVFFIIITFPLDSQQLQNPFYISFRFFVFVPLGGAWWIKRSDGELVIDLQALYSRGWTDSGSSCSGRSLLAVLHFLQSPPIRQVMENFPKRFLLDKISILEFTFTSCGFSLVSSYWYGRERRKLTPGSSQRLVTSHYLL